MLADCFSSAGEEGITATFYFGHLLVMLFGVHCSMVQAGLGLHLARKLTRGVGHRTCSMEWEGKREYTGQVF